jgi:hypothetical protein
VAPDELPWDRNIAGLGRPEIEDARPHPAAGRIPGKPESNQVLALQVVLRSECVGRPRLAAVVTLETAARLAGRLDQQAAAAAENDLIFALLQKSCRHGHPHPARGHQRLFRAER